MMKVQGVKGGLTLSGPSGGSIAFYKVDTFLERCSLNMKLSRVSFALGSYFSN